MTDLTYFVLLHVIFGPRLRCVDFMLKTVWYTTDAICTYSPFTTASPIFLTGMLYIALHYCEHVTQILYQVFDLYTCLT